MVEKFTHGKNMVGRPIRPPGLDADGYGGRKAGGAETGAEMLAARRNGRGGIQATVLGTGFVPDMAVAAKTRPEQAARASNGGVHGMWGQNQLMDASVVRPFVGSARDWTKP